MSKIKYNLLHCIAEIDLEALSDCTRSEMIEAIIHGMKGLKDMSDKELVEYARSYFINDGDSIRMLALYEALTKFEYELAVEKELA